MTPASPQKTHEYDDQECAKKEDDTRHGAHSQKHMLTHKTMVFRSFATAKNEGYDDIGTNQSEEKPPRSFAKTNIPPKDDIKVTDCTNNGVSTRTDRISNKRTIMTVSSRSVDRHRRGQASSLLASIPISCLHQHPSECECMQRIVCEGSRLRAIDRSLDRFAPPWHSHLESNLCMVNEPSEQDIRHELHVRRASPWSRRARKAPPFTMRARPPAANHASRKREKQCVSRQEAVR